nr:hypothetical protein BCU49_06270 [Vibrio breoganii]
MGRYKEYSEYKDSNIQWLGNVPTNWLVSKLGYFIETIVPMRDKPTSLKGEIPWIRIEDFNGKYISQSKSGQGVTRSLIINMHLKVFPVGTVLCSCSCSMGTTAIVEKPLISNQTFIGLVPLNGLDSEYLYYLMGASSSELTSKSSGAIQSYLSQDEFKALKFAFPTLNEQQKIANFLDHETAKIDTLIAKQEKLIELLKEKRQAVISHAVTKGLNPQAPMKDSGVEWLGEVPEHWSITPIRNLLRSQKLKMQDGNHGELHPVAADYVDDGIPFLMANNVRNGSVNIQNAKKISFELAETLRIGFAKAGDMLLTHKGTVGEVGFVPEDIKEPYWMLTPQVTYYRWQDSNLGGAYFGYLFQSKSIATQLELMGGKQSTRAYVGLIAQADLIVVIPPRSEQQDIENYLRDKTNSLDKILEKSHLQIDLLKERKTALISAAVTGKIDVRDWQTQGVQG